jgi:UDP-GlcNAc:undecaprenyl-phosphate/decaprenyl-phosphate GlcNAc-1-phosphate transferase
MSIDFIAPPFIVSFLIALILTPWGIKFAKKYKLVDDPKTHKHPAIIHTRPIPRAGGLAILIAIIISSLYFFWPLNTVYLMILFSCCIVVGVGLVDDKYDLSPYIRFMLNILSAILVVAAGVRIPFVTNPLGGILEFNNLQLPLYMEYFAVYIPHMLAVIWIVWVMNMLNWSKGVDGQMPGIAGVAAIIIGIASLRFPDLTSSSTMAAQMAFIVAGASLGFLPYNFHPARMFPGYSCTVLGFLIGILSILSGVKLATAILVMGVPMVDALFTIARRILAKKSPFWHDREHLHHLLLQVGMSQRMIAIFYWGVSLILGIIALQLSSRGKLFAIISVIIIVSGVILFLRFLGKREKNV